MPPATFGRYGKNTLELLANSIADTLNMSKAARFSVIKDSAGNDLDFDLVLLRALGVRAWGWVLAIGILFTAAGIICMMDPWISVAAVGLTVGLVLILLPMTTSRIVMVLLGLLVALLGVLMAWDRLKNGMPLSDGGSIIDSQ